MWFATKQLQHTISMFLLLENNVMVWEKLTTEEEEKAYPTVFTSFIRLKDKTIFSSSVHMETVSSSIY